MCTGVKFNDDKGHIYFGRNLDLNENHYDEQPILIPKGYEMNYRHMASKKISKAIIGMGINANNYPLLFEAGSEDGMGSR